MKNLNYFILLTSFCFLFGCANNKESLPQPEEVPCENGCLFTVQKVEGTVIFMECFQKYGIQTAYPDDPDMKIYGIPSGINKTYQEDGIEVIFSAAFRENSLVPQFPDPSFNPESIFEIEIYFIE